MLYDLRLQLTQRLVALDAWINDLIRWSRPGLHVKRWVLLLLIALTATALGIAFFLVDVYRTQPFPSSSTTSRCNSLTGRGAVPCSSSAVSA